MELKLVCEYCQYTTYSLLDLQGHKAKEHPGGQEAVTRRMPHEEDKKERTASYIVGFDWFNTITQFPILFAGLSHMIHDLGGTVLVVSAATAIQNQYKYKEKLEKNLEEIGFYYDEAIIVPFESSQQIPSLKTEVAKRYGITHFYDDRGDVVESMKVYGIKATRVPRILKSSV